MVVWVKTPLSGSVVQHLFSVVMVMIRFYQALLLKQRLMVDWVMIQFMPSMVWVVGSFMVARVKIQLMFLRMITMKGTVDQV